MKSGINISRLKPESIPHIILKALLTQSLDTLPAEHLEIYNRWHQINNLIRKRMLEDAQVSKFMVEAYGISKSQSYEDIRQAKAFFAITRHDDREYKRGTYIEWLEEAAKKAFAEGKWKEFQALIKEAGELQHMKTILPDRPKYEDIQPYQPTIVYDPNLISAPAAAADRTQLKERWLASKRKQQQAEDAEYEDVTNG